jgi:hypothetical protein
MNNTDIKIKIPKELLIIAPDSVIEPNMGKIRVTWKDQKGKVHELREMEDDHLSNLWNFLLRNSWEKTWQIVDCEVQRRVVGAYPDDFEALCAAYKKKPELRNMKIHLK